MWLALLCYVGQERKNEFNFLANPKITSGIYLSRR